MRELILTVVVGALCLAALVRPRIGLCGYIWFALMRPDALAFATDNSSFSWYLGVATLAGSVRYIGRTVRAAKTPFSVLLLSLQLVFYVSSLAAIEPALCAYQMEVQTRVTLMALLQLVLIETPEQLRNLLLLMGLSLGAIGVKLGAYAVIHRGVVYADGYVGFLSDNNNIALAMVMTIGLCWELRRLTASKLVRAGLVAVIGGAIVTVIMTHSRGGLLALTVVALLAAFRSKHKALVLAAFALMTLPAIYLVRDSFFERMSTLGDPLQEQSAKSRVVLARAGWQIANDYPFLGVGFGGENERRIIGRYLKDEDGEGPGLYLHNTYIQVAADSGLFAAALYAGLLGGAILWLGRAARRARASWPEWEPVPAAIRAALAGYAVGACFLSRVTFDFTYMLLMAAASWYTFERALRRAREGASDVQEACGESFAVSPA